MYELLPEDNHASDALWRADEVALIRDALESRVPPLQWWSWLAGMRVGVGGGGGVRCIRVEVEVGWG